MTSDSKHTTFGLGAYRPAGMVSRLGWLLVTWQGRARARRALARLDGHLLRDIGLDPLSARGEASRRFWQD